MSRRTIYILVGLCACAQAAAYYEDHFNGSTLDPAWTVWGTGAYTVAGGTLQFATEQGDFVDDFENLYGVPRHVFLISPPPGTTQWVAETRVRFETPDERYEQVNMLAFEDKDHYVKNAWQSGGPRLEQTVLSEYGASSSETPALVAHSGFFWMRLVRNGTSYSAYYSDDLTTDPDLVNWTFLAAKENLITDPMVGIGGWNARSVPSGELAEFDYFRFTIVPEPATVVVGLLALTIRRRA